MMQDDLIEKTLSQWTKGKDKKASRISIFQHIRDIPYAILPELINYQTGPKKLLQYKKGSCSPKHFLLGKMFQKLGLKVQYVTYPFYYSQQDFIFSKRFKDLIEQLPSFYHLACKVEIKDRDIIVDATWDLALAKKGFPVNTKWDGMNDTLLAVKALDEIYHKSPFERKKFVKQKEGEWTDKDRINVRRFCKEFNMWLDEIRDSVSSS